MTPGLTLLALAAAIVAATTGHAATLGCMPHEFLLEGIVVETSGKSMLRIEIGSEASALLKLYGPVKSGQRLLGCQARIDEAFRQEPRTTS